MHLFQIVAFSLVANLQFQATDPIAVRQVEAWRSEVSLYGDLFPGSDDFFHGESEALDYALQVLREDGSGPKASGRLQQQADYLEEYARFWPAQEIEGEEAAYSAAIRLIDMNLRVSGRAAR